MRTESPSSVALWCACPGAYDLHYRQGVEAPARPFFDLGKAGHYIAEEVLRGKALESALPEAFAAYRLDGGQYNELADMAVNLPDMIKATAPAKTLAVEEWLGPVQIHGYPFRGRADWIQQNDEAIILTDWKTSHRVPSQKEIDNDLQLADYAVMAAQKWPDAPRFLLQYAYLRYGVFRTRLIEAEAIPEQAALLAHQLKAIAEAKKFPFTPGLACANCLYVHACKYSWEPGSINDRAAAVLNLEAQADAHRDALRAYCADGGVVPVGDKVFTFYEGGKKFGLRAA